VRAPYAEPMTAATAGVPVDAIQRAADRIDGTVVRSPLVRLHVPESRAEIYLKLENLQPIGAFKLRGAYNAMVGVARDRLGSRVVTTSAGNMALGVAWTARALGIDAVVVAPDHAPAAKVDAIEALGAEVVKVSVDEWFRTLVDGPPPGMDGYFVHPVEDELVMAGNGTIGLEILEDLPDVDAVYVPCGGGGLASGIASALRASGRDVPLHAVQPDTAAPLAAAFAAGEPTDIAFRPSFVDGAGAKLVLPRMWPRLRALVASAPVVSLDQVADAIRLLVERVHVVAEGAGALAVAAALADPDLQGKVVAVVSGGNIDSDVLCRILSGATP
jgi:threonine dehydratase